MVLPILGLTTFIASNPGFAAWVLGGLVTTIGILLAAHYGYIAKRINSLEASDNQLKDEINDIQVQLAEYKDHVGAGDLRLIEIRTSIDDHVTKEENIFWKKIEAISEAQRISNEALLQRMASVEAKMPNGEIKELVLAVARVEAAVMVVRAEASSAASRAEEAVNKAQGISDRSEEWKDRISTNTEKLRNMEALSVRLDDHISESAAFLREARTFRVKRKAVRGKK